MPINQDQTETTKSATPTQAQDKPSAGMDASTNKPGAPTNVPGRTENEKPATQPDAVRAPDANKKPGDSTGDPKFGKSAESPKKGL